jgi:hypothetical protein
MLHHAKLVDGFLRKATGLGVVVVLDPQEGVDAGGDLKDPFEGIGAVV